MAKLTDAQIAVLRAMDAGHHMSFSQDGDMAWLTPKHETGFLTDEQTIGLRKLGYIAAAPTHPDDPEEKYYRFGPPDIITDAGRAALARQGATDEA